MHRDLQFTRLERQTEHPMKTPANGKATRPFPVLSQQKAQRQFVRVADASQA